MTFFEVWLAWLKSSRAIVCPHLPQIHLKNPNLTCLGQSVQPPSTSPIGLHFRSNQNSVLRKPGISEKLSNSSSLDKFFLPTSWYPNFTLHFSPLCFLDFSSFSTSSSPTSLLVGGGVSWRWRAQEGRELPHASEERPLLLRARPGSAAGGDASLLLRVGPAGWSCQGREASIQDPIRGQTTTSLQRSVDTMLCFVLLSWCVKKSQTHFEKSFHPNIAFQQKWL